ncbi:MAG: ATP-binding protein [Leptolyngbyaceae cyanobacterium]
MDLRPLTQNSDHSLETVFDRFEQLDTSDVRHHQGGTGLGLAICRSIVQQHDGKIWAQSTVGIGTTFYFTLPILTQPALEK